MKRIKTKDIADFIHWYQDDLDKDIRDYCGKDNELTFAEWEDYALSYAPHGARENILRYLNNIAKHDEGKLFGGLLQEWPHALAMVLKVGTFGAKKYGRGSWPTVPNGQVRYTDAMFRHLLSEPLQNFDNESGLPHAAHTAWNALSRLELMLTQDKTFDNV
jgi:hypothetical protein